MTYLDFLKTKVEVAPVSGFSVSPEELSPILKPHQRDAVTWALKLNRRGLMTELNEGYFRDAVGYLHEEEAKADVPSLFDLIEQEG